jgi:hypothetical protein
MSKLEEREVFSVLVVFTVFSGGGCNGNNTKIGGEMVKI